MCGITGFVSTKSIDIEKARDVLPKMVQALSHRGPDEQGFHYDKYAALGMARLKIIDMYTGSQPFYNHDKSICVIFNGEIYNFKSLRKELIKDGFEFKSECDTEVILYLYIKYETKFVDYLNGMFAISIWDYNRKRLLLVRDRLGIKPLYYSQPIENTVYFASETFSLKENPKLNLTILPAAIDLYLAYRSVPAPFCIYKEVKKVMPGEMLIFQNGKLESRSYWQLNFRPDYSKTLDDFTDEFIDVLQRSVNLQSFSDAPMGCFLSGGLDSSLLTALLVNGGFNNLKTFFVRAGSDYFDESIYAQQVSNLYNTDHEILEIPTSFKDDFESIINSFDEPFAHPTMFPTYYLARETKKHVDMVLSGEGSDEVFAGYGRYKTELLAQKVKSNPKIILKFSEILLKGIQNVIPVRSISRNKIDRALNKLSMLGINDDLRYVRHFQPFYLNGRKSLIHPEYIDSFDNTDSFYLNRMDSYSGFFTRRYNLDLSTWLPDQMLAKADRMTMAHSLEARVPFLDHKLVEFSTTIPEEMKFSLFASKIIVRNAAYKYFPKKFVRRPKHGLAVPLNKLFRNELKEVMYDIVEDAKNQIAFINHDYVGSIIENHLHNKENNGQKILSLVNLFSWISN